MTLPSGERLALPQGTKRKEAAGASLSEEEAELIVTVPKEPPPPRVRGLDSSPGASAVGAGPPEWAERKPPPGWEAMGGDATDAGVNATEADNDDDVDVDFDFPVPDPPFPPFLAIAPASSSGPRILDTNAAVSGQSASP